jgi:hypothetical protein
MIAWTTPISVAGSSSEIRSTTCRSSAIATVGVALLDQRHRIVLGPFRRRQCRTELGELQRRPARLMARDCWQSGHENLQIGHIEMQFVLVSFRNDNRFSLKNFAFNHCAPYPIRI